VAELTGVPSPTLRAWERRYGVPSPPRTRSAYRAYTPDDVRVIVTMRKLVDGGMSAGDAAAAVRSAPPPAPSEADPLRDFFALTVERILEAVMAYDADAVDRELSLAAMATNALTLYERIVSPAMVRIGDGWREGKLTIAQEHLASDRFAAITRAHLRLLQPASPSHHVVLGSFADDDHVIGLLGAALSFAAYGFQVTMLGARTPPVAIGDAVRALAPDLVGLSLTQAPPPHRARELVDGYADAVGSTVWVVGGVAAGEIEPLVVARGGIVAKGHGSEWIKEARRWLRSTPAPQEAARPARRDRGRLR
jgi:DNA-binding transcriptional MerR regulator/methylmalonyl-CoA mutase cobalamin-binding subunit